MIYTDRSRWEKGMQRCPRARFLEYDAFGKGLKQTTLSVALSTGTYVHKILESLMRDCKENPGAMPGRENVRIAVAGALEAYRADVDVAGFDEINPEYVEQRQYVVDEQAHLIECLGWAAYRIFLPWFTDNFDVLEVENEEVYVAGCGCGLGTLPDIAAHEGRACNGVILMARPDMVARNKTTKAVSVWDFKTSSGTPDIFVEDHRIQFAIGTLGVEARLSEPVTQYYTTSLLKGRREADRSDFSDDKMKKQRSPLCYCYYKLADPPFGQAVYRWEYTREKGFNRVPVWEIMKAETWVMDTLPEEKLQEIIVVSPPQQRPDFVMKRFVQQLVSYEQNRVVPAMPYESLEQVEELLDRTIPQSWDCYPFKDSPCSYLPICMKHPGWETPLSMVREDGKPKYQLRVSHHAPELEMLEAG